MASQGNQDDFERLCREIVGNVAKGITTAGGAIGDAIGQAVEGAVEGYRANQAQAQQQAALASQKAALAQQQALLDARFGRAAKVKRGGILRTVFGSILSFSFGLPLLSCIVTAPLLGIPEAIVGAAIMAVFFVPSFALLLNGTKRLKMGQQLNTLKRIFGNREAVPIAEIAQATGQKPAKVLSAIQELLRRGLLPEGHLDAEQTTLIVTNEAYQHYLQLQSRKQQQILEEQRKRAEAAADAQAASAANDGLSPEARTFISTGSNYLAQIHQLDVDIDDKAVSARIVHIEEVVGRILERVKADPSLIDQLGRLTDYYLPTTVKLLSAYDALEEQAVQGDNIRSSRQEIESTLDVLIQAYEKLLDGTFADLSMDVSSEISVLHTILAQEGLTESPFDHKPGKAADN